MGVKGFPSREECVKNRLGKGRHVQGKGEVQCGQSMKYTGKEERGGRKNWAVSRW